MNKPPRIAVKFSNFLEHLVEKIYAMPTMEKIAWILGLAILDLLVCATIAWLK